MARAAKPKLVRFEDGIHWLVAKLAAQKSGLTRPELARRALAGELRYQADKYGMPIWYAEPDIDPLRQINLQSTLTKPKPKTNPKTLAQLEREWAKAPKLNQGGYRLGPVSAHLETIMLSDIHKKAESDKD